MEDNARCESLCNQCTCNDVKKMDRLPDQLIWPSLKFTFCISDWSRRAHSLDPHTELSRKQHNRKICTYRTEGHWEIVSLTICAVSLVFAHAEFFHTMTLISHTVSIPSTLVVLVTFLRCCNQGTFGHKEKCPLEPWPCFTIRSYLLPILS